MFKWNFSKAAFDLLRGPERRRWGTPRLPRPSKEARRGWRSRKINKFPTRDEADNSRYTTPPAIWLLLSIRQLKYLGFIKNYHSQNEPYFSERAIPRPAPPIPWFSQPGRQGGQACLESIRSAIWTHTTEREFVYTKLRYDRKFWNAQLKRWKKLKV